MHCSHWTGKKASIDFDRNWATFTAISHGPLALRSDSPRAIWLREKWDSFFNHRSTAVWGADTCSLAEKWHGDTRGTLTYLGRHFVRLLNHFSLWFFDLCYFFFSFGRATSSKLFFIANSSFWKKKKTGFVFVAMSSSATIAALVLGWME